MTSSPEGMRGGTFSTVQYTLDTFQELLISYSDAAPGLIDEKLKSGYFRDYFRQIGVKTIVAEKHYVDHDYLEDFAAYYVKCFTSYKRTCARLHFFTTEFDQEEFRAFLMGESTLTTKTLEKSYAGFLVIRPLPASVIGSRSQTT